MVYCGKPSRGCLVCRTRRIKCDETKPTCLQCQKSRRQCPGYKDDFDLVFRNETVATERRARRNLTKAQKLINSQAGQRLDFHHASAGSVTTSSLVRISPVSATSSSLPNLSVPGPMLIPVVQQATNFFMSNFVFMPQQGTTRGYLDFLVPMVKSEPADSLFGIAFNAVALAALGNRPHAKVLLVPAVEKYNTAIRLVNEALRDPVSQRTDQTLATVLLLGLFENITSRRTAIAAWGSHIEGAVMIVKIRGKKQLRTKIGNSLFKVVRTQMMINCLSASKSPDLGSDWWISDAIKDEMTQNVTRLSLLTAELRADVNRSMTMMPRTPENRVKVLGLLRRAQELEQCFLDWIANIPDHWRFRTAAWVDSIPGDDIAKSDIYPGKIDTYTDLVIAATWNNLRVARLFLSGAVIRCAAWICSPTDYRTTPEYASAARLGVDMINDLIASVPFHLGWQDARELELRRADISSFACGTNSANECKGLGAYFTIWPLFTASCSDFTTDKQREWIKGRMLFMQDTMGINQAGTLSYFQLRLPSMIVKRDGMGLQAPNAAILTSARGPTADYPLNPLFSSNTGSSIVPNPIPFQSRPSAFSYSGNSGRSPEPMIDDALTKAREDWTVRQKREWECQALEYERRKNELLEEKMSENDGIMSRRILEGYFATDTIRTVP